MEHKSMAKKILLIEDDTLLVNMYKAKLVSEGFEIMIAHEGEKGLEMALKENPDLILLDMMLPKLSGEDFLKKLQSDPEASKIPVLVLSNLSNPKDSKTAISLGAKEYLVKANLTPGQVVEKVRKYL